MHKPTADLLLALAFAEVAGQPQSTPQLSGVAGMLPTCFNTGTYAIMKDIHDGDMKRVDFLSNSSIRITPHGGNQTWSVVAPIDRDTCSAVVDFRVAGKPSPPPCPLSVIFLRLTEIKGTIVGSMALFTDPSGTLPPGPLNAWISVPQP